MIKYIKLFNAQFRASSSRLCDIDLMTNGAKSLTRRESGPFIKDRKIQDYNQNKTHTTENLKMKLLSIFAMIAATMLVNTEAVKIQAQIEAPQQEVSSILELAEVESDKKVPKKRSNTNTKGAAAPTYAQTISNSDNNEQGFGFFRGGRYGGKN